MVMKGIYFPEPGIASRVLRDLKSRTCKGAAQLVKQEARQLRPPRLTALIAWEASTRRARALSRAPQLLLVTKSPSTLPGRLILRNALTERPALARRMTV